jgi:hypothetical protein
MDKDVLEIHGDPTVGTVVKVWHLLQQIQFSVQMMFILLHFSLAHLNITVITM